MENTKLGRQTFRPGRPPTIVGHGSSAGYKESQGPLGRHFDHTCKDDAFGEKSWEMAESRMQQLALDAALMRAGLHTPDLDLLLAGDLLNQCIGSSFAARQANVPYLGLYGACSTMGEGLALAALLLAGGYGQYAAAVTCVTIGRVVDKGIKDAANMGAAMAPAAYDTLRAHFEDTGRGPDYYDLIVTGDLGKLGGEIVTEFFSQDGAPLSNYSDCGLLLFDLKEQDVHSGGSGCGCSAAVLCGHLLPGLLAGRWKRVLFCPTGALLSPTSTQQGESIPGVCHAVALEGGH